MIDQIYLHSINLQDSIVCNNFALPMPLPSLLPASHYMFNTPMTVPLYNCNPDDLLLNPEKCFSGTVSPVYRTLCMAAYIRRNMPIFNGLGKEILHSEKDKNKMLSKSELEVEFEKVRRNEFPNKPSRISSLFLAENNEDGKIVLSDVFSDRVRKGDYAPLVLTVKVICLYSSHRGDIHWLYEYRDTKDIDAIRSYWQGLPCRRQPLFEYLLEGIIIPTNREQIEELRSSGNFFPESSRHWQNLSDVNFLNHEEDQRGENH